MEPSNLIERMRELSRNLYWAWHPEVLRLFSDLDLDLWREVNHNPVEFLTRLEEKTVADRSAKLSLESRLGQALQRLQGYLASDRAWGLWHAGPLGHRPVVYFCSEFGLHESLPIYSGGLGVLAGDHLKAASDLAIPMIGVGLFYARGYFQQTVDTSGWQHEHYPEADLPPMPLEAVVNQQGRRLRVTVRLGGYDVQVQAWSAMVGRNRLVLLDTNAEGNSQADRALTSTLYGGDRRVTRQEAILGIGGVRMIAAMGTHIGVLHANEGHAAFATMELTRQLMERDGQSFDNMREVASAMTVFTTHTPVPEGHDRFEPQLMREMLDAYRHQLKLSERDFMALGRVNPNDEHEPFCMTVLGLRMSRYRNAVSALHGHISRAMWHGLWPHLPREQVPIHYITNGVHVHTWLADPLAELYARHLGPDWMERIDSPELWAEIEHIDDIEFWNADQTMRTHLVDYVRRSLHHQAQTRGDSQAICDRALESLHPQTLTVGFARRFAGYKRAYLVLHDKEWLDWMVNGPRPVQFIFAGKAHPNDHAAKLTLQEVFKVTRDPRFAGKVVFLENYSISVARHMVQGADLWLNNPRRPLEACGTSGQKSAMNGGLNLSTLDGWWAEAFDGTNGFAIGHGAEHADWDHQDQEDLASLKHNLEHVAVPAFYERDQNGVPRRWVAIQKRAVRTLMWRFSARRMLIDYALGCYLPAVGGLTSSLTVGARAETTYLGNPATDWVRRPGSPVSG